MKLLSKIWTCWYFAVLTALICGLLFGCHKKPKMDPFDDVPDLPGDTVYITRLVDRCDYQYLSLDPKISKKQMDGMIKALDNFILQNDSIIKNRMSVIRAQQALIRTFPEKDPNPGS